MIDCKPPAATEYGPCRCPGCRFEPAPTRLFDGLCGMCAEDGCDPVIAEYDAYLKRKRVLAATGPAGTEADR